MNQLLDPISFIATSFIINQKRVIKEKIDNIQCKVCISITGGTQGTVENGRAPKYLTNHLNIKINLSYNIRASKQINVTKFAKKSKNFKNSFFPFCNSEWYKKDNFLRKAENIKRCKSMFRKFINLKKRSLFAIHELTGVKRARVKN